MYVGQSHDITHFNSFAVEHIPAEIKKFISNKNITSNIFRIKAYDSTISGYFCIEFIDFMLKGKSLLDYTNLFPPNEYQKNDKNNTKMFSITKKVKMRKYIVLFVEIVKNLKTLK